MYRFLTALKCYLPGVLLLGVAGLFSQLAYSADPTVCTPTGYVPAIYIHQNFTVNPAGTMWSEGYAFSQPAAQVGPITCTNSTPTAAAIQSLSADGHRSVVDGSAIKDIGQGFSMYLAVSNRMGAVGTGMSMRGISYNSPNITENIYPSLVVYPAKQIEATHDIDLENVLVGYIYTSGKRYTETYTPTDMSGMTAIYYSGRIHIPPYCTYSPDNNYLTLPPVFSSDFTAAGLGGKVGSPVRFPGKGICAGGSTNGDGDIVHISVTGVSGDGTDMLGINNLPDVGIQVSDNEGNILPVNVPESATVVTVPSYDAKNSGLFDYPLTFQLVSRTGKAPPAKAFTAFVIINLTMD